MVDFMESDKSMADRPMENIVNIALAYEETTMLGVKYMKKFNEIMDDLNEKGGYSTIDEMFAMGYLHGLIDMSQVTASIVSGRHVQELDEHLMRVFDDMFSGRYWREQEDEGETEHWLEKSDEGETEDE